MIETADFKTPVSSTSKEVPPFSLPPTTDAMNWRKMERSKQAEYQDDLLQRHYFGQQEHPEDVQQRHFNSHQPKVSKRQHRYPTRSKQVANEAETAPKKVKEFVFLKDKGEEEPIWKQFEIVL